MTSGIKITGNPNNRKVFLKVSQLRNMTNQGIRKAFYLSGRQLLQTSKELIDKPKSGRVYRIKKGNRTILHRASAPGEAPAKISGNLRRSLNFKVQGSEQLIFGSKKLKGYGYPRRLELGINIAARPFLIASIRQNVGIMQNYFKDQVKKAVK